MQQTITIPQHQKWEQEGRGWSVNNEWHVQGNGSPEGHRDVHCGAPRYIATGEASKHVYVLTIRYTNAYKKN